MIIDLPSRLLIAYGLIALLVLGAALLFWRVAYNTRSRREARSRRSAHYRQQARRTEL